MKAKFMLGNAVVELEAANIDEIKKKIVEFFTEIDIQVRDFEYHEDFDIVAVVLMPKKININIKEV